jgi:hypothetical protein
MTTTTRPMSIEERTALEGHLNPGPSGTPSRVMGLFMGVPVGFTALIVLNLSLPGPAFFRVLLAVAVGAGAAWLFGRWMEARRAEMFRPAPQVEDVLRKDLADGRVVVRRYEAEAVVKVVADRSRFVSATYFVKLADGSVALLVGPHLEEAEFRGEFPATAFEIASGESSQYVLSVKKTGEKLVALKTRAPLSDAEWEEIGDDDDESVPLGWAEIVERAARNPLTRETLQRQAQERAAVDKELDEILAETTPPPADPIRPK